MRGLCLALIVLSACTGDDETLLPDATQPPDAAPLPDVFTADADLDDPGDLPHLDCPPGTLPDAAELPGVWALDRLFMFPGGTETGVASIKIVTDGDGLAVATGPQSQVPVEVSDGDLFWRTVTEGDTITVTRAFTICGSDDAGHILGASGRCIRGPDFLDCLYGTFTGTKVLRRAGEGVSQGISLVGEYRGAGWSPFALPVNVRVEDGLAYLVALDDGLRIIDVSNPAVPVELGHAGTTYNDVKLVTRQADGKRFALCSQDDVGIDVVDVSDPMNPSIVTTIGSNSHTVFVEGNRLYAPRAYSGVWVWDVTDPAAPVELGRFDTPREAFVHDLYVADSIIYANVWNAGLFILDASDPAHIVELGRYDAYERRTNHSNWVTTLDGCKVSVTGDEDFGAHLRIVGVDPSPACSDQWLELLGEWQTRPEVSIHNIMAFGSTVFMAHYQDGVRVLDISQPATPVETAYFNTWSLSDATGYNFFEGAVGIDVDLASQLIYVADIPRGLLILHLDD